jgi:hypothetical protein
MHHPCSVYKSKVGVVYACTIPFRVLISTQGRVVHTNFVSLDILILGRIYYFRNGLYISMKHGTKYLKKMQYIFPQESVYEHIFRQYILLSLGGTYFFICGIYFFQYFCRQGI